MHYLEYSGFTSVTTKGGFIQAACLVQKQPNALKLHTIVKVLLTISNPKSPNCQIKILVNIFRYMESSIIMCPLPGLYVENLQRGGGGGELERGGAAASNIRGSTGRQS